MKKEKNTAGSPAEERAPAVERPAVDPVKRKKRIALIVILSLCLAFAVILPLTLIDYSDLRSVVIPQDVPKILYAPVDQGNIWENETYLSDTVKKTLRAAAGGVSVDRAFENEEEALAAFEALKTLPSGGEVLGAYFSFLIKGLPRTDAPAFAALFDASYTGEKPTFFMPQKLYGLYFDCVSGGEDQAEWSLRFSVLDNDGMAVSYLPSRDSGEARFVLKRDERNVWKIAQIRTVYPMY